MTSLLSILSIVLSISAKLALSDSPQVTLPNGDILGRQATTAVGVTYNVFEGIPFAQPPIGSLRFQSPQPVENWNGVLETTQYKAVCFQSSGDSDMESEDCLYLNVYVPQYPEGNNTDLAVMFFIYGGGFVDGDCRWCGPDFFINNGVILVTTNYRVGAFGFLSTEDLVIPGNSGLKDQQFAIKWTKDNIALFGGDPEKITIFGQSAGSASATYQLLNENSEGLFRAVIGESGSFLSAWAYQRNARQIAFATAAILNDTFNTNDNSEDLLEFLMGLPARDLDQAAGIYGQHDTPEETQIVQGFFWTPVIEPEHPDAFLTEKMFGKLKSGDFVKVPLFIGINSEEDLFYADNMDSLTSRLQLYDDNLDLLVPFDMRIESLADRVEMGSKIRDIYTGGEPLVDNPAAGIRLLSDESFTKSVIKHAQLQSNFTNVYFYQFSHFGPMGDYHVTVEGAEKVRHGEEGRYLFHQAWDGYDNADTSAFPEADVLAQARILKAFTDFAKFLNPTPEPSDLMQNVIWPTVSAGGAGDLLYVDIDDNLEIRNRPKGDAFAQWEELYQSLGYDDFDTY